MENPEWIPTQSHTVTVQPATLKTSTVGRGLYGNAQPSWGVTALQRTVKDGHRSAVT